MIPMTHLDRLQIKPEPILLIGQEVLHILALVALELDNFAHLDIAHDSAIAGELLLDHFEDLLLVKFLGETLHRRQGFAAIALCGRLAGMLCGACMCRHSCCRKVGVSAFARTSRRGRWSQEATLPLCTAWERRVSSFFCNTRGGVVWELRRDSEA